MRSFVDSECEWECESSSVCCGCVEQRCACECEENCGGGGGGGYSAREVVRPTSKRESVDTCVLLLVLDVIAAADAVAACGDGVTA